jgi:hypothetical protein
MRLSEKQQKWAEDLLKVVELLPSKYKALSLNQYH